MAGWVIIIVEYAKQLNNKNTKNKFLLLAINSPYDIYLYKVDIEFMYGHE